MNRASACPPPGPLTPPYTPEIEEQLARWMPPGAAIEPLGLFRTIMRHERSQLGCVHLEPESWARAPRYHLACGR